MFQRRHLPGIISILAVLGLVACHPGEHHDDIKEQIIARDHLASISARSLQECMDSTDSILRAKRATQRREESVQSLRKKRSLEDCMSQNSIRLAKKN
jgi:hypothetical protein